MKRIDNGKADSAESRNANHVGEGKTIYRPETPKRCLTEKNEHDEFDGCRFDKNAKTFSDLCEL